MLPGSGVATGLELVIGVVCGVGLGEGEFDGESDDDGEAASGNGSGPEAPPPQLTNVNKVHRVITGVNFIAVFFIILSTLIHFNYE